VEEPVSGETFQQRPDEDNLLLLGPEGRLPIIEPVQESLAEGSVSNLPLLALELRRSIDLWLFHGRNHRRSRLAFFDLAESILLIFEPPLKRS
jgi:hypothetical protein